MANRLGPVSAAWSRPCPAKGAGRAADQDLPRGELGSGRVVAITFKATDIAVSARDSNPHGPRPAASATGSPPARRSGARVRGRYSVSIFANVCRGLWPGRGRFRAAGRPEQLFGAAQWSCLTTTRVCRARSRRSGVASPSVPIGFKKIQHRPPRRGDLALVKLPPKIADLAAEREYLHHGPPISSNRSRPLVEIACAASGVPFLLGGASPLP
jgi:hypothetical protein